MIASPLWTTGRTHVDNPAFNILSLCSGGGGLDLGVGLAVRNARTVCYVENEAYACEVLGSRVEDQTLDAAPVWTDLKTFYGRPWRGVVDCITAGYPCQPFSVAGKRGGEDDPRHLWPHIQRAIRDVAPAYVFLENVPGHLVLGFDRVLGQIAEMGYRATWGIVSAAEVGASHKRERLFCLAYAEIGDKRERQRIKETAGTGAESGAEGHDAELADADDSRRGQATPGRRPQERITADRSGRKLAHTESGGEPRCATRSGEVESGRSGVRMDNPLLRRYGSSEEEICTGWNGTFNASLPLFPPGPGNLDAWREVLEIDPTLEPAICLLDDGLAPRVEQLRLSGNGVCPLQAGYAWCALKAVLEREVV